MYFTNKRFWILESLNYMEEDGYDCVGWKVMPWKQPIMSHNSGTLHINDMDMYIHFFATKQGQGPVSI